MGRRRQSREMVLKIIFQIDMGKLDASEVIAYFIRQQKASEQVIDYAKTVAEGVIKEQENIDQLIRKHTLKWELERIAGVDRSLLRIAVYELLRCPDIPKNVVLNEAIELAKKYSTQESSAFINGILDKIASSLQ